MQTAAEATKRGPDFVSQLDFVLANILMALLADLALVYLPAPTIAYGSDGVSAAQGAEANAVQRFLQSCPENRFDPTTQRAIRSIQGPLLSSTALYIPDPNS